ncbi:MAG: FISUMP domain-containing protein [Thermoanaerobaculia bacterium]
MERSRGDTREGAAAVTSAGPRPTLGVLAALLLGVPVLGGADGLARRSSPDEAYPGLQVEYGTVSAPGGPRLRTIVTKPAAAKGRLPALFLAGWLSCDSVEAPPKMRGSTASMIRGLASRSEMLFFRVDKPGVGDSAGICGETDFETELAGYRAAFRQLAARPDVDPSRIFIFGWSNGGGFAPLIPEGAPVDGYVVSGGWVKTWFEHMMEFERRQRMLSGRSPGDVNDAMRRVEELYDLYLNRGMTPGAVVKARPDLADVYSDDPDRQYGRPARFSQQLQKLDLEAAWARVDSPVLVIHGEYDFIMGREDHERIAAIVNARHPGFALFVERPRMDHVFGLHASPQDGMNLMGSGAFDEGALAMILAWLRGHASVGDSTLADPRDGQTYLLVRIAGMTWFGRNLDYPAEGSFCFDAKPESCGQFGRLYPWRIAREACPAGSHLSTDAEWKAVEKFLGMDPAELDQTRGRGPRVGDALKAGGKSGLDILLSGWRNPRGLFREGNGDDRAAALWTADEPRPGVAWHRDVSSARSVVWRSEVEEPYALSVRCVLDPALR